MSTTGWPKPGDKMRFLGKNGYDFQREQALRVMTVGDVFTVHSISVGESSHSIVFREIGGNWNGVMFEWLNAPAASPSPASPADDVAGLIDRAEQLAASLNRGSADIVLELAAALSRIQARLAEVTAERDTEKRLRQFAEQWYAERLEPIKDAAKRAGIWPEVAAIIANGTSSPLEPPTYAQQLNLAKHRAEKAAASAATMREALIDCQRVLALLADRHVAVSAPNVVSIWAQTVAAEAKARAALGGQHG